MVTHRARGPCCYSVDIVTHRTGGPLLLCWHSDIVTHWAGGPCCYPVDRHRVRWPPVLLCWQSDPQGRWPMLLLCWHSDPQATHRTSGPCYLLTVGYSGPQGRWPIFTWEMFLYQQLKPIASHAWILASTTMCACTCAGVRTHMHMCTHTHTHIHTHTHTHTLYHIMWLNRPNTWNTWQLKLDRYFRFFTV